ncbi:conserved hypothetical protein [Oleispira antarctica RB-8]|uniref:MAPEG family protein n=1 Tax=Oleispira antarctica RB-8 TaxID=698738 RepID=R4YNY7_OLEAN|nr:conserved hypothetical protein [Oleispira antarctica RB-8]
MNNDLIFLPVLAHVALVFMLYIYLGIVKSRAVKKGSVDRKKAALDPKAWPVSVVKVLNNLGNQFESPVIFYIISIIYYLTNNVDSFLISIMSIYVLTRYMHTYIHVTSNFVPHRFKLFLAGVLILLALTIWLALKLIGL